MLGTAHTGDTKRVKGSRSRVAVFPWLFCYGCGTERHPDLEFSTYPLENLAPRLLELSLRTPITAGGSGPFAHLPPLGLSAPSSLPASQFINHPHQEC